MKSPFSFLRSAIPVVLVLLGGALAVQAQDEYASMKNWEATDFAARRIAVNDIDALTIDDLKLVRGIVFGRHGRVFKDPDIRRFLENDLRFLKQI